MIPTIDPKVRYVGSSYLRGMNAEQLRQLESAVVVQDSGDNPLVVIVPYETYLKLQEAARETIVATAAIAETISEFPPARELLVELDGDDNG